ncbi:hypothetical protein CVT26_005844 [Gymnopilus dilepis]|uniref:GPI-anchor transamidase n=1 Tax=Gymnopilus dilepis TaxID=231916 RepID=A0A409WFZ3_9AGAR|nr:hypothetical protein CVT26_005844 [Gymnopilus dilepis]
MLFLSIFHLVLCLPSWAWGVYAVDPQETLVRNFFDQNGSSTSNHTNNWAVLVCSSRYWFNYRHMANALGISPTRHGRRYRTVKRLGIPDSNIILMLADDASCNSRNKFPGSVYANPGRHLDLYGENIEVDYRGYEVTVENFIRVLTGRMDPSVPRSKRLLSDERSNIFVYMTGHGGNEFLKFQDNEEISAFDIADAFEQMYQKRRYNEIFFMIDTCQANTMYSKLYSPNILATGSSDLDENSYSYANDNDIGVAVIDSFTHYVLEFMEKINKTSQTSMQELFDSMDFSKIGSHPGVRSDLFNRPLDKTLITDFFGGVAQVEIVPPPDPISPIRDSELASAEDIQEALKVEQTVRRPAVSHPSSQKELLAWLTLPDRNAVRSQNNELGLKSNSQALHIDRFAASAMAAAHCGISSLLLVRQNSLFLSCLSQVGIVGSLTLQRFTRAFMRVLAFAGYETCNCCRLTDQSAYVKAYTTSLSLPTSDVLLEDSDYDSRNVLQTWNARAQIARSLNGICLLEHAYIRYYSWITNPLDGCYWRQALNRVTAGNRKSRRTRKNVPALNIQSQGSFINLI